MRTLAPARVSSSAALRPDTPPPTTTTRSLQEEDACLGQHVFAHYIRLQIACSERGINSRGSSRHAGMTASSFTCHNAVHTNNV